MVSQSSGLVFQLLFNFSAKPVQMVRISGTGKHEILPYQNPFPVTELIEILSLIQSSAPDAQHIKIGIHCLLQKLLYLLVRHPCINGIIWDPVSAFAEHRYIIYIELESSLVSFHR